MQGIRLNEITSLIRYLLEPNTSVVIHVMWKVELIRAMQDLSSFTLCPPGVSRYPVPPRAVVLRSPLRLSIKAFRRSDFSTPQSLAGSFTWVSCTLRGQKVTFGGLSPHSIQRVGAKGEAIWELIRGWGILVHPSPPGLAYLQPTSFIGRIFASLYMG